MKKKLLLSTAAILLTVTLVGITSVWADGGSHSPHSGGSFRTVLNTVFSIFDGLKGLAKDVNLTDAQKESIKTILTTAKPQADQFHQQLMTKRHELREALLVAS